MSRLENAPSRSEVARMTAALVDIFCRSFPAPRSGWWGSGVLGHGNAFSFDCGSKWCSSVGSSWTKKITLAAIPFEAAQAHQSSASTRISRWTKRDASGVGMRWTTPRSLSRLAVTWRQEVVLTGTTVPDGLQHYQH